METLEEHMAKIREWQKDFDIPDAMLPLFVALFQKKSGGNPNPLTRMMRDSPNYHKMTVGVFYELARVGSMTCNGGELLQKCKELLSATGKLSHSNFLRFRSTAAKYRFCMPNRRRPFSTT